VWLCTHIETGAVRAVKRIDRKKTTASMIKTELYFLSDLQHECITACHDVFHDPTYVNVVLEVFEGGDLIDGLQKHWAQWGPLADSTLARVSEQMLIPVSYLHSLRIIHRDIKGENYLCDKPFTKDGECRIALADFGTAVQARQGELLTEQIGTPQFWSPEVWASEYAELVDVWAVGVTSFVLLADSLPYDTEAEMCEPAVLGQDARLNSLLRLAHASPACTDFVTSCLTKNAHLRPSAAEMLGHAWLTMLDVERPSALVPSNYPRTIVNETASCFQWATFSLICAALRDPSSFAAAAGSCKSTAVKGSCKSTAVEGAGHVNEAFQDTIMGA